MATTPIPQPPTIPFLGNLTQLNVERDVPMRALELLAEQYGEIIRLDIVGRKVIMCFSAKLQNALSNDARFAKTVRGPLEEVRHATGDGLFTAHTHEPNWGKAHRLLMPAFGPAAVRDMFDDMNDICSQMCLKWERFGPHCEFDPTEDFTKLTLDTIALCSMSYRINSFYTEHPPPFVQAMSDFLTESGARARRPALVAALAAVTGAGAKYAADTAVMQALCRTIIAERRAGPVEKTDLLEIMLNGRDPKTGEGLDEDSIMYNLITFLIAGHETTSGMLSFAVYELCKSADASARLRAEVDAVAGAAPLAPAHLARMPYLTAVMRETLRLHPTAAARQVCALEDTVLDGRDGRYAVKKGEALVLHTAIMQGDADAWGDDAKLFRPERMLDGGFENAPPNAWQPFGFGLRGCIGRPFAWQEAQLVLASIYQTFDVLLADPSYTLRLKQSLTIKPRGLRVRARLRPGRHVQGAARLVKQPGAPGAAPAAETGVGTGTGRDREGRKPLYVFYGSNTGTSEAFAQRIANDAAAHGFVAQIATLDAAAMHVATDGAVVICVASYEGEPPDNAAHFVRWLQGLQGDAFGGVRFAVFGAGNSEWVRTYQRVPALCDELLAARGGVRLVPRGAGDAASADFFEAFERFEAGLWAALMKEFATEESAATGLQVKVVDAGTTRASALRQNDAAFGLVKENRLLTSPNAPEKRHIEFELPENVSSQAGDYLAILPTNPERDIRRVLARFHMTADQEVVLSSEGLTSLPVDKAITVSALVSGYVELSQPATTRDLRTLAAATASPTTREALDKLLASHADEVVAKRLSVLDILEAHPDIDLPFGAFLGLLPAMRVRQYSISSSPLWNARRATLTVSVLDAPALSGRGERFLGVGSTFLAGLRAGDRVQMAVRPSAAAFHLPPDPSEPVVMFCAGAGLAPMRGFIQERAAQKQAGRDVGRMLLFFGCRSPTEDFLYSETDLKAWAELGVVDIRPAFSRSSAESEGCKYVQDRILHDRADLIKAFAEGARFYACGSGKAAAGIKKSLVEIIRDDRQVDDAAAEVSFEKVKGRYVTDIFD